MPLPFILGGLALAAAGYGTKKGLDAKDDFDSAKRINRKAERIYDEAKDELEEARESTKDALETLGKEKFTLYKASIIPFINHYTKITNIPKKEQLSYNKERESNSDIGDMDLSEISLELKEIVGGGITSLGSGGLVGLASYGSVGMFASASTGTAIGGLSGVAATNATLAWLGGGSLASGGLGMAGGMAVLGGIVAGPVLAVGGMVLSSKAEEAKENAYSNLSQAELASEEMKTATVKTTGIERRVNELLEVSIAINNYFEPLLKKFIQLVNQQSNWKKFSSSEKELVLKTGLFSKTLFNLLEVTVLTKDGDLTNESQEAITNSQKLLEAK